MAHTQIRDNSQPIHFWDADKSVRTACLVGAGRVRNVTDDRHTVTCGDCIGALPEPPFPGSEQPAQSTWAVSAMLHEGCGDCMILAQPAASMARVRGSRESTYTEHNHGTEHSVTVVRVAGGGILIHL